MTPRENIRPLSTLERFDLVANAIRETMGAYGYSGAVADFAMAQAALETGLFTSDLFKRANNAFGMRVARVRPQNRIGESNGYAVFDTVRDGVADYFARQRNFGIPNTNDRNTYIDATVASGYATAGHYGQAWAALLDQVAASDYGTAFALDDTPGTDAPTVAASGSGALGLLLLVGYLIASE